MSRRARWNITPAHPQAEDLATRLKISPVVAQALLNRDIRDAAAGETFLRPSLRELHDPNLLPGMAVASARIARAIRDGEKIVIYGDYDADGITATAILWHAIRLLCGQVEYYIPHRVDQGYGLVTEAIEQLAASGARLIVTVDCGITAIAPAQRARELGVDLIITDHHQWHCKADTGEIELPDCLALVHPRIGLDAAGKTSTPSATDPSPLQPSAFTLQPSPYPNPHLCGAGVAFKLAWGIGQAMNGSNRVEESFRNFLIEATALAALGTVADVVPLRGENRVLAHFGLGALMQTRLAGIRALIESAGLTGQKIDGYHAGFLLGPRLNASGRMDHAREAVELLTDASPERAREIAATLDAQNRQRQAIEKRILAQAMEQVAEKGLDNDRCRAVVLADAQWHQGVVGIVASRLVERLCRPVILISMKETEGHGSGRSIADFDLAGALSACGEFLESHGGHAMAAGLRVRADRLDAFREAFTNFAAQHVRPEMLQPILSLEGETNLAQISASMVNDLSRLGPFGMGNRRPVFCVKGVTIAAPPRRVGKTGEHLQLMLRQGERTIKCIAFNQADTIDQLNPGVAVDVAAEPMLNEFNGRVNVELKVNDWRKG
jgi:single-stranded-DNA-specific exonuclease